MNALVVFLGAHRWPHVSNLDTSCALLKSAEGLLRFFREAGVHEEGVCWLFDDDRSAAEQTQHVLEFLDRRKSFDPQYVFVCYLGHGQDFRREYHLFLQGTRDDVAEMSSLRWRDFAQEVAVRANRIGVPVFAIIDACFSGAAGNLSCPGQFSILAAAAADFEAIAPMGAEYTVFSESLLRVLNDGSLAGEDTLTLDALRDCVHIDIEQRANNTGVLPRPLVRSPGRDPTDPAKLPLFANHRGSGRAILPRARVFDAETDLPGQVFAIELLCSQHVTLSHRHGRIRVTINRKDTERGIFSYAGKKALIRETFPTEDAVAEAEKIDAEVHEYLLGEGGTHAFRIDQENLRWASGGVLSIVRWRDGRTWIPFFFRDIRPIGWNISLGASEKHDDLNDPWSFLIREFLEETLVLDRPPSLDEVCVCRPFNFRRTIIANEMQLARQFMEKHVRQRRRKDGLNCRFGGEEFSIDIRQSNTNTELLVVGGGNGPPTPETDVLVCINTLELGIEVIKVIEYTLRDNDYLLDGELDLGAGAAQELVRMPVALISTDYLGQAFGKGFRPEYRGRTMPSVLAPDIPEDQIHVFPHDVVRRSELAESERATPWERRRFASWMRKFQSHFYGPGARPCSIFTPASAKLMSYYFADSARR